jgi:hypothetical protein
MALNVAHYYSLAIISIWQFPTMKSNTDGMQSTVFSCPFSINIYTKNVDEKI